VERLGEDETEREARAERVRLMEGEGERESPDRGEEEGKTGVIEGDGEEESVRVLSRVTVVRGIEGEALRVRRGGVRDGEEEAEGEKGEVSEGLLLGLLASE